MWIDFLVTIVILLIIGLAIFKVVSDKKKGKKCGGCPYAEENKKCNCK